MNRVNINGLIIHTFFPTMQSKYLDNPLFVFTQVMTVVENTLTVRPEGICLCYRLTLIRT